MKWISFTGESGEPQYLNFSTLKSSIVRQERKWLSTTFGLTLLFVGRMMEVYNLPLTFSDLFSNLATKGFFTFALLSFLSNAWTTCSHAQLSNYHAQLRTWCFSPVNLEALHRGKQTSWLPFTDKGAKAQTEKAWFSKECTFPAPFNFTRKKACSTLENQALYDFCKSNCLTP